MSSCYIYMFIKVYITNIYYTISLVRKIFGKKLQETCRINAAAAGFVCELNEQRRIPLGEAHVRSTAIRVGFALRMNAYPITSRDGETFDNEFSQ